MRNKVAEGKLATLLALGGFTVSIFMLSGSVTDPVNVTKFFILGGFATGVGFLLIFQHRDSLIKLPRTEILVTLAFIGAAVVSLFLSKAPLVQSMYGSYGRNTGFFSYTFLTILFAGTLILREKTSHLLIVRALMAAGLINVLYSLWVFFIGDFMAWNNTYKTLLGTFGNPNFVGSFLAIFASLAFLFVLDSATEVIWRVFAAVIAVIAMLQVLSTNVMQGKVLILIGFSLAIGAKIRSSNWPRLIFRIYSASVVLAGLFSIAGILQKGPIAPYIYQYTVSLRGQYWQAGIHTGLNHPLTGVGFDSFGDWYRRMRSAKALISPGINTVTNSAHNVFIDFFSNGGFPLLFAYLAINILVLISIIKTASKSRKYDPIFLGLSISWVCYTAQSIISINQIGLAVWGWILAGSVISFSKSQNNVTDEIRKPEKSKQQKNEQFLSSGLIASLGFVLGLFVAVPPLSADMAWRSAQVNRDAAQLKIALQPNYLHPQNTMMYLNSIILFSNAGLTSEAKELHSQALKFSPDSFELWRLFYFSTYASPKEKERAFNNMVRLDPLNPDVTVISE